MKNLICGLLLLFITVNGYSQKYTNKYDWNFKGYNNCRWSWIVGGWSTMPSLDTINKVNTVKLSYSNYWRDHGIISEFNQDMRFALSQIMPLPSYKKGEICTISLKERATNIKDLFLVVTTLDNNEHVLFQDSVKLMNNKFEIKKISFKLSSEKALRVNIDYYGNNDPLQKIYLQGIDVKIGKKSIANYKVSKINGELKKEFSKGLNKKYLVPLNKKDNKSLLPILETIKTKRIIGLGECTHGSWEIKESVSQFIRSLIEDGNAKLIMIELPIDLLLKYNLYVQGITPKDYIKQIEEDAKCYLCDYKSLCNLLIWIRSFNDINKSKIYFCGIDEICQPQISLFQFYSILLGNDRAFPYLKLVKNKQYQQLIDLSKSDSTILNSVGDSFFKFYMFILGQCISFQQNRENTFTRDQHMAKNIQELVNIFLKDNERAVVYAHSMHLSLCPFIKDYPFIRLTTGSYLNQMFGKAYFPISFQIGTGAYTDDECSKVSEKVPVLLPAPLPQSFEAVSMNSGLKYFYYPSVHLNKNIILFNEIPRESHYMNKDIFLSPQKHFEGFVYIDSSGPLRNTVKKPLLYALEYYDQESKKLEKSTSYSIQLNTKH